MFSLDNDLFLLLNAGSDPSPIVAFLAIFIAKFVVLAVPLLLAWRWIAGGRRNRLTVIALVLAFAFALVVSYLIGLLAFRPRPFVIGLGHALVEHRPNGSFPSNHGLAFAVCAVLLFLVRQKSAAWLMAGLGILVAWSRIYVGVHYPLDMIGAAIIAVPVTMASLWVVDRHGLTILNLLEHLQRRILGRFARS